MSAPESRDPLVVNTRDGMCWKRQHVDGDGRGLYALAGVAACPAYVLASFEELAERGIVEVADALPMPVGPEPQALSVERLAEIRSLLRYETSISFHSARAKESMLLLLAEVEQWRATYGADSLPGALARLARAEARVAELEALKPATIQTCRKCGAGYTYGEPCSACAFEARMAAELQAREPEFHSSLHHDYKPGLGRDLPETGGVSAAEPAAVCRCGEPDADPYECEADDCTAEFSELNPFGGGGPVAGWDAKVSRTCGCGWRTSSWHVDDGSAEEELHRHVVRVHGGAYPARTGGA